MTQPNAQDETAERPLDSPMQQRPEQQELTAEVRAQLDEAIRQGKAEPPQAPPFVPANYQRDLDFGYALLALKAGKRVRRSGWLSANYYLYVDARYPNRICYMNFTDRLSDDDLFASDWEII